MNTFPENIGTAVDQLNRSLEEIKAKFVGKDDIIDLLGICLAGRENLFLLGPPGTAKSAIVHELGKHLQGQTFEYLLTRFTEPNELFGPFDIRKLREGELLTNTEGMLPEAHLVFLDELLNANSAILNSLLMVLNERVFRRGRENRPLPALLFVGASNQLPEDESLQALFDRFLLRVESNNVDPELLANVLKAGWALESKQDRDFVRLSSAAILQLQNFVGQVDLAPILPRYLDLVQQLRNAGIPLSDRRAVKLQRLIAASALICKRQAAQPSDLWILRYIWDNLEQREIIASIVNVAVQEDKAEQQHPRALISGLPNAEELFQEINELAKAWEEAKEDLAQQSKIKDRLRHLDSRSQWIANEVQKQYVREPLQALWRSILAQG
jgi:MoxR-like ATPase